MLSKRFGPASLLLAAVACPACNTVDRAGQDALVVGMFPIHALTTPYQQTASALKDDGASPWVSPLIFAGHFAEDVGVTVISAGDLGISPALGFVELVSDEDDHLGPLHMYTFVQFPPEFHKAKARNVESDVAEGAAKGAVVVVVISAVVLAGYYGHSGSWDLGRGVTYDPPPPKNFP